ncbi:Threonylcarbamoyl-AMP synthase [Rhodocyclaceae bacterium]|nr:Threonylcarbamoyl-AMP synthase [Rhodocyclaceae bacterium]
MTEIDRAVALLRTGELVAFPTETVYGLGADAANPAAVAKIFAAKGRPADHPLIVHLPGHDHIDRWARDVPAAAYELAEAFWPGPLTLILKRAPGVPDAVTGGQDTVGLRVPGHPLALELLRAFDGGVAAPSANRFGRISPTTAQHVREELGAAVALVLDGGPCRVGIESTILDLSRGRPVILRPGMIGAEALASVLGEMPASGAGEAAPRVSGSLDAHYAPTTPLAVVPPDVVIFAVREALARGERIAVLAPMDGPFEHERIHWRRAPADPDAFARDLYAALRELDTMGFARIVVQKPPATAGWQAIHDRLRRAAAGAGAEAT